MSTGAFGEEGMQIGHEGAFGLGPGFPAEVAAARIWKISIPPGHHVDMSVGRRLTGSNSVVDANIESG